MINEKIAELMAILGNDIRISTLKLIAVEPRSFTDLLKHLSLESNSKLSFHLNKMKDLIEKRDIDGYYRLTELGLHAYNLVVNAGSIENDLNDIPIPDQKDLITKQQPGNKEFEKKLKNEKRTEYPFIPIFMINNLILILLNISSLYFFDLSINFNFLLIINMIFISAINLILCYYLSIEFNRSFFIIFALMIYNFLIISIIYLGILINNYILVTGFSEYFSKYFNFLNIEISDFFFIERYLIEKVFSAIIVNILFLIFIYIVIYFLNTKWAEKENSFIFWFKNSTQNSKLGLNIFIILLPFLILLAFPNTNKNPYDFLNNVSPSIILILASLSIGVIFYLLSLIDYNFKIVILKFNISQIIKPILISIAYSLFPALILFFHLRIIVWKGLSTNAIGNALFAVIILIVIPILVLLSEIAFKNLISKTIVIIFSDKPGINKKTTKKFKLKSPIYYLIPTLIIASYFSILDNTFNYYYIFYDFPRFLDQINLGDGYILFLSFFILLLILLITNFSLNKIVLISYLKLFDELGDKKITILKITTFAMSFIFILLTIPYFMENLYRIRGFSYYFIVPLGYNIIVGILFTVFFVALLMGNLFIYKDFTTVKDRLSTFIVIFISFSILFIVTFQLFWGTIVW